MNQSKNQIPNSIMKASREEINELELEIFEQESNELISVENLPDDLSGHVFICAPLPYGDGSFVLNGDGMIYRLDLVAGKTKLKTKIAKTPCYYADLAIQNQPNKYPSNFKFHNGGSSRMSQVLGSRNQLNTAFLKTSEKLFITFDAGRPYEIDPSSLEILEPIGSTKNWQENVFYTIFDAYFNPAHPVIDLKGLKSNKSVNYQENLFTINYSTGYKGKLKKHIIPILQWIKNMLNMVKKQIPIKMNINKLINFIQFHLGYTKLVFFDFITKNFHSLEMILPDGQIVSPEQTIHQMAITEDYIIFMDIAFKIEWSQIFSPFWLKYIIKFKKNIIKIINILCLFQFSQNRSNVKNILSVIDRCIYSKFLQFIPPEPYTNLYIVNRKLLSNKIREKHQYNHNQIEVKKVTIPFEVSHFSVDYSNPDNKIILHVGHNNGSDVTESIRKYDLPVRENKLVQKLVGMMVGTTDLGRLARYIIDAETGIVNDAKIISDPRFTWSLSVYTHRELCNQSMNETADTVKNIYWMSWGFSWKNIPKRIYKFYQNSRFRHIHHTQLPEDSKPTQLLRLDTEKMEIVDSFEFPYGHFACTPQFIPSSLPCPEGKDLSIHGYIICVVLADNPDNSNQPQDEFWILHADDFNNKPVYRLRSPHLDLGLTIHSTWLENINKEKYSENQRRQKREISVYEDYRESIKNRPKIKELFDDFVYSNFIQQTPEAKLRQQK